MACTHCVTELALSGTMSAMRVLAGVEALRVTLILSICCRSKLEAWRRHSAARLTTSCLAASLSCTSSCDAPAVGSRCVGRPRSEVLLLCQPASLRAPRGLQLGQLGLRASPVGLTLSCSQFEARFVGGICARHGESGWSKSKLFPTTQMFEAILPLPL